MTVAELENDYRTAVTDLKDLQARLGSLPKGDPAREEAKQEVDALVSRIRDTKDAITREVQRRNFAGLNSALHQAIVTKLDPAVVAELEADALARQDEHARAVAERRSLKVAAKPIEVPSAPRAPGPEVIRLLARPRPTSAPSTTPTRTAPSSRRASGLRGEVAETFSEARRAR